MSAWKTSTLGEVVSIAGGGTPTRSNPDFYGGTIPWVTPKDMKSWEITGAQIKLTQAGVDNSATRVVPQNSILIVVRSGVLKHTIPVGLNRIPVAINQDMKALQCRSGIDVDYLARFIKARSPVILQWVRATTADNFPIDKLKNLPVPLPPLAEQRWIADVLDRAEALRANRRAALAQLDSLTQSLFLDLFGDPATNPKGWPKTTLGEIIEFVGGSQPPRETFTYEPSPDTIRLVQIRDFRTDVFKTYIPRKLARRFFETDDVMIGRYGPPVFQILRGLSGSYNVALMKALPRGEVLKDFIFHLLQEQRLHAFVVGRSERTAGQSGVNLELLEKYPAYLPSIKLQREFTRRVTAVEALKTAQRASLAELDALFATLQHRAFRGEL